MADTGELPWRPERLGARVEGMRLDPPRPITAGNGLLPLRRRPGLVARGHAIEDRGEAGVMVTVRLETLGEMEPELPV